MYFLHWLFKESWFITINTTEGTKNLKNIKLAAHAGFCYGVKRAVETTKKLKAQHPDSEISVLGELIHNSHVISELKNCGIKTLTSLPSKGEGICVIRSHGESAQVFEQVKNIGYELVDLTCLDVKKVQNKAVDLAKKGYFLIILGKPEHPEVKAIEANAKMEAKSPDDIFVASNVSDLEKIEDKIKQARKVGVVLQTTQTKEYLFDVIDYLNPRCKVLHIENTICPSTSLRQQEAKELAKNSDLMVVVGSKKSANTTHLAELLKEITKTIHIEDENELDNFSQIIRNSKNIGVTAGASTPDSIINEVINKLERTI